MTARNNVRRRRVVRILTLAAIILLFCAAAVFPAAAAAEAEDETEDEEETAAASPSVSDEEKSWWQNVLDWFDSLDSGLWDIDNDLIDGFGDLKKDLGELLENFVSLKDYLGELVAEALTKIFDFIDEIPEKLTERLTEALTLVETFPIKTGGYLFVTDSLNEAIAAGYQYFYPWGVGVLLVCWVIGFAKNTLSGAVDISAKNSIVRSALDLVLGILLMSLVPSLMTVMTSISRQMCYAVADTVGAKMDFSNLVNAVWYMLFLLIVQFILMLNLCYMALLQCLAPIFVGFAGSGSTRRIALNFGKEYLKCCLVPPITGLYMYLATHIMSSPGTLFVGGGVIIPLIGGLVVALSATGIAGKKLEALFR